MLATILLSALLAYFAYRAVARPKNFPPGPMTFPLVGYLPFLRPEMHRQMAKLSEKYGDVFGLSIGSFNVVMLGSLRAIREAFKEDSLSGRPDFIIFMKRTDNKKGVIFSEGQNWQDVRRFTLRNLRDFGLGKSSMESVIQLEIGELVSNLDASAGTAINLANRFNLAILNALWTMTTGDRFSHDDPDALKSVEEMNKLIARNSSAGNAIEFLPFLANLGPFKRNIEDRLKGFDPLNEIVMKMIDKHRESHIPGDESDLVHAFLERMSKDDDPDSSFSEVNGILNLKNLVIDLFIAGTETTSTSLLWLVLLMATYPEIQEKIQEEIDIHVPRDVMPSLGHRSKLVYTEATLRESMRFTSMVPLGAFHAALADTSFRGYTIPKGTIVFSNLYQVHHDPEHWAKPDEFYPEHFLNEDGSLRSPEAFIPFAIGKRACLGESLAKMEFYLFAAALLQKFKFKFPADQPQPTLAPHCGGVLSPKPYEVLIELRQ
nr:CYP370C2 protein [Diaphanosoma celebensis]